MSLYIYITPCIKIRRVIHLNRHSICWVGSRVQFHLSDYRGDKKRLRWNFKFEVYRAADQAKAGQMEEGAFAEAQVPYAKFGLRKSSVPCGQPRAAKSAATRCDAKQQRPDDKKPAKTRNRLHADSGV